jgi:outer membrane protein assembly factor BamD
MKNIIKILFLILTILLVSCSKEEKISIIEEENVETQMIEAFEIGYEALIDGDTLYAAKKFNEAELLYPQSQWAPKAALMAGYTYYSDNYYGDAIFEIERYLKTYPNHKNVDYGHFLLAMCYYETIVDEKRDLEPLLKAKRKFEFVMNNFPNTDFSMDSKFKLELISDKLAAKQMYIAKHYLKKEKWIPAISRYKKIVEDYSTTIYVEEALHRLVEIHYRIGLKQESEKYAKLLGYNYQSSKWYKESYKVFNKDYKIKKKIVKKKKKKGLIWKKFKSLFKAATNL